MSKGLVIVSLTVIVVGIVWIELFEEIILFFFTCFLGL